MSLLAYILIVRILACPDRDRVFERAAELFGLLATPVRLRIVAALLQGERNVSQLTEGLGAAQPTLSQHLATLYHCGLVSRRRLGAQVLYSIADERRPVLERLMSASPLASLNFCTPTP
jgi:DNA-binding transcriptional ArsR family regulator